MAGSVRNRHATGGTGWGGRQPEREDRDPEDAAVTVQVDMTGDRTRWRVEVATRHLPVPYLLSPAEKEKLGAFPVMAFGHVIRAKM